MSGNPTQFGTTAEDAAYLAGLRIRELMASPEYRAGNPLVHAQVEAAYRRAYPGQQAASVIGPGQAPAGGFGRD